ncbi:hypothetical protein [Arthrobacter sp. JUb115]|uniref:hypothetical protein n=1 Tax=Arthrobacter sp. JUb115 TaxID=2485108 RepID=UPI00105B5A63|nr:hypothetical protein [Arthrobacter sp. JUb115]TDU26039.1 hypothetical protein EDF61_105102 [Arthrobacter sp. JUb115]
MLNDKQISAESFDNPAKTKGKKKRWGLILSSILVVGALAGGVFWGMNLVNPKESEEYLALSESHSAVAAERDSLQSDFDELEAGIAGREEAVEERGAALDEQAANLDTRDQELQDAEDKVAAREKAVGKIEAEQLENSVEDGVWTVGSDIKAGTYRAKEAVGSDCYWAVVKTGTNGSDIIDNGIPGGGRPAVTVKKGQDFESKRCGTWVKQ